MSWFGFGGSKTDDADADDEAADAKKEGDDGEELLDGDGEADEEEEEDAEDDEDADEGKEDGDGGDAEDAADGEDAADEEEEEEQEEVKPKKKKKKKKGGPAKAATYNCEIFDVTFTNALEETISPFFHFTLGGKIEKIDKRDEGGDIENKVTLGPKFETDTILRIPPEDMGQCLKTKRMQWFGTYSELAEEKLRIKAIHRPACCTHCGCDTWRGCKRVKMTVVKKKLLGIANGCVSQEFEIVEDRGRVGMVGIGQLRFNIFFEELFDFTIELLEWQGRELYAADEGGTSDPYLVVSIKGDWYKMFTKGGMSGRRVISHTEYNTLFPKWPELPEPLFYNGTWTELQNEILMIQVFDWDMFGTNQCIGWARIPLNGQFRDNGDTAEGQVRSALAMSKTEKQEVNPGKFEQVKVIETAGEIIGSVRIESMPKYKQFGAPAILQSGVQYICMEIVCANNLPSTDDNGLTDAFFVVEWEGMVQSTKVVFKTLEPIYKEKLYFPVLLFNFSAEELAKKDPAMKIACYDFDPDGSCDFQGFAEFQLFEITQSKEATVDGLTGRVAVKTAVPLQKSRSKNATVDFRVWFDPSPLEDADGDEIILERPKEKAVATLPELYTNRSEEWFDAMKQVAPRAWRKSQPLGGFIYKSFDEHSVEHFLPCYLHPLAGPLDLQNPKEVFRMVSCITFETDMDISNDADAWASPKFFLDIKKGDSEDHAMLCANLFLGLGIDTYVCVGKACVQTMDELTEEVTVGPGEDTHTWVMTRPGDGSVIFWESCTGKEYQLLKRWGGSDDNQQEEDDEEEADGEGEEEEDGDEDKAFAAFYEDDVTLNNEQLIAKDFWRNEMMDHANATAFGGASDDSSEEEEDLGLPVPPVLPPYYSVQVVFNHENVWANLQNLNPVKCMYEIDNAEQWKPFCSFEDGFSLESSDTLPFYKPPTVPARLKMERAKKVKKDILACLKEGLNYLRESKTLEIIILEPDDTPGPHMEDVLGKGLKLLEDRLLANDENKRDAIKARLSSWKSELIKSAPPNVSFEGIPINFSYCDGKRIKTRICEKYEEFLMDSEPDVQFCFGVYVAPYYCSVNSTWVYVGKMHALTEEDD